MAKAHSWRPSETAEAEMYVGKSFDADIQLDDILEKGQNENKL